MLSLYEAVDHVDVAEAVAEDLRIGVTITMDAQDEDEEEDETNIEDLLRVLPPRWCGVLVELLN